MGITVQNSLWSLRDKDMLRPSVLLVPLCIMKNPKIGKAYTFVRKRGDAFEYTDFTRHDDGSSEFVVDGHAWVFECRLDAWQQALAELERLGFVELREARVSGFVPADWQPKPDTSTLHTCEAIIPTSHEPPFA